MENTSQIVGYELSISGRENGTLEAAYIRFKHGAVKKTKELIEDTLLADYNARGELLGIEILAPVRIADLAKHVEGPRRRSFRRFVRDMAPPSLIRA
jgi:uncharacterized protein YuzE